LEMRISKVRVVADVWEISEAAERLAPLSRDMLSVTGPTKYRKIMFRRNDTEVG
jgi:hypothetical protein